MSGRSGFPKGNCFSLCYIYHDQESSKATSWTVEEAVRVKLQVVFFSWPLASKQLELPACNQSLREEAWGAFYVSSKANLRYSLVDVATGSVGIGSLSSR